MAKKRYKINYAEGDCFAVPLCDGGFARGVIARMNKKGVVLGYFFGPKILKITDIYITPDMIPANCIDASFFGHLGLVTNEWTVIGKIAPWIRGDWPIPIYGFIDPIWKKWGELRYTSEKDLLTSVFQRVSVEEASLHLQNGLSGSKAVEIYLNKLLREGNTPPPVRIVPVPQEYQKMMENEKGVLIREVPPIQKPDSSVVVHPVSSDPKTPGSATDSGEKPDDRPLDKSEPSRYNLTKSMVFGI